MIVDRDVAIAVRDGVILYADVFRPDTDVPAAPIVAWGPYGKHGQPWLRNYFGDSGVRKEWTSQYTAFEAPDPLAWCPRGYAVVNVDPRGAFLSEGDLTFRSRQEAEDCFDVIEWCAAQPWSNGAVGMVGISYLASIQWFTAAMRPPHLRAISLWEGNIDWYRERDFHGGIPESAFLGLWQQMTWFSTNRVEDVVAMRDQHPMLDEYYRSKIPDLSSIVVPAQIVAGWADQGLHTRGTIEGFKQIASEHKWLEVHGRKKWEWFYMPENVQRQIAFCDHFLLGVDNDVPDIPRVRLQIREAGTRSRWRTAREWPPAQTQYRMLHLDSSGFALTHTAPAGESALRYDADRPDSGLRLEYVFATPTDVVGNMKLRLWVQAEGADDMDLFVGVEKLDAHGEPVGFPFNGTHDDGPVALGWLRVSHRELDEERSTPCQPWHTHAREQLLEPGEIVPVEIEIWPSATRFEAGERLVLLIQGTDVRTYAAGTGATASKHENTRNTGTHVVHVGGRWDSHLLIPTLPE